MPRKAVIDLMVRNIAVHQGFPSKSRAMSSMDVIYVVMDETASLAPASALLGVIFKVIYAENRAESGFRA